MIGRNGPLRPFELIRWARAQATEHDLRPTEAHVLIVLATYANADAIAWPSLKTLAADCRRGRTQIASALRTLEDLQIVWSSQSGNGRSARRELLFNPDPAIRAAGRLDENGNAPAVRPADPQQSGQPDPKCQGTARTAISEQRSQSSSLNGQEQPSGEPDGCRPSSRKRGKKTGTNGMQSIGELLRAQGYQP